MKLIINSFLKDFRYACVWIILTWLVALSMLLFPLIIPLDKRANAIPLLEIGRYLLVLLTVLTIGILVVIDSPGRQSSFIKTRPVSVSRLCMEKGIAILVLIVPLSFHECFLLRLMGLEISYFDHVLGILENLLLLGSIASVALVLALLTKTFLRYLILSSLIGFLSVVAWNFYKLEAARYFYQSWDLKFEYLKISRVILTQVIVLAGALAGIAIFAIRRRRLMLVFSVGGIAMLAALTTMYWPINFLQTFVPRPRVAPRGEWPDQSKIQVVFAKNTNYPNSEQILSATDGEWYGDTNRRIDSSYQLMGLSHDWVHGFASYQSTLALSNGHKIQRQANMWTLLDPSITLRRMGIMHESPKDFGQATLMELLVKDAAGAMTNASLTGNIGIQFLRPVILARVPFKKGATIKLDARELVVTKLDINSKNIQYEIVYQNHILGFKGSRYAEPPFTYLVINAARKEYLKKGGSGESNLEIGHYFVRLSQTTGYICEGDSWDRKPVSPEWLDGAELLVLAEESGGTIKVPFQFSNINLSSQP